MRPIQNPPKNILLALLVSSLGLLGIILFHTLRIFFTVQIVLVAADPLIFPDTRIFQQKRNLLTVSEIELQAAIEKQYPLAKNVEVRKQFPKTLLISAVKRLPIVQINSSTGVIFVDETGKILPEPDSSFNKSVLIPVECPLPETSIGEQIASPQIILSAAVAQSFAEKFSDPIEKINCLNDDAVKITVVHTDIILPVGKPLETFISSLQLLFKQFRIEGNHPQTIDLRFEKAVVIPQNVTATSSAVDQ